MGDGNSCPICHLAIAHSLLMCSRHWRQVPGVLQTKIYGLFRRERGSDAHREACFEAIRLVHQQQRGEKES